VGQLKAHLAEKFADKVLLPTIFPSSHIPPTGPHSAVSGPPPLHGAGFRQARSVWLLAPPALESANASPMLRQAPTVSSRVFAGQVEFSNDPVDVGQSPDKPFEVKVDGAVIYSHLAPVSGEKGPILFESNKWWGEPDPGLPCPRSLHALRTAATPATCSRVFHPRCRAGREWER